MARPLGEVTKAMQMAAAHGPCTVKELARRAQVGFALAAVTASRMIKRGQLVRLNEDRPAVVALPAAPLPPAAYVDLTSTLSSWYSSVGSRGTSGGPAPERQES